MYGQSFHDDGEKTVGLPSTGFVRHPSVLYDFISSGMSVRKVLGLLTCCMSQDRLRLHDHLKQKL